MKQEINQRTFERTCNNSCQHLALFLGAVLSSRIYGAREQFESLLALVKCTFKMLEVFKHEKPDWPDPDSCILRIYCGVESVPGLQIRRKVTYLFYRNYSSLLTTNGGISPETTWTSHYHSNERWSTVCFCGRKPRRIPTNFVPCFL
jgi:hypothetical protein